MFIQGKDLCGFLNLSAQKKIGKLEKQMVSELPSIALASILEEKN